MSRFLALVFLLSLILVACSNAPAIAVSIDFPTAIPTAALTAVPTLRLPVKPTMTSTEVSTPTKPDPTPTLDHRPRVVLTVDDGWGGYLLTRCWTSWPLKTPTLPFS